MECDIMNIIDKITAKQIRTDLPEFRVGDTVRVDVKIIEGKRERIQAFEGIVISKKNAGVSEKDRNTIYNKLKDLDTDATYSFISKK